MSEKPRGSADQVAVVTGGARGIGLAVSGALADRGYHVVILDNGVQLDGRRPDHGVAAQAALRLRARGGKAEGLACDVAQADLVAEAFADTGRRHGRVDVLVNVAGILRPGPFLDDTPQTWDAVLAAHLAGHLNTIGAVVPLMLARSSGRIINFTSTAALLGSRRQPAYSTAKEAVIGLSRQLAALLAPSGITVNAISPAAITRMSSGLRPAHDEGLAGLSPELYDRDPARVGRFVCWLSAAGAAGITGKIFLVTGNYVAEYEHMRLWKWVLTAPGEEAQLEERLRWVIGRPHPTLIGPWPTREFALPAVERRWEGTSIGPDLLAGTAAEPAGPATGTVVAFGAEDDRSAAVLAQVGRVIRIGDRAGQASPGKGPLAGGAAGAVVMAPGISRSHPADLSHLPGGQAPILPDPGAACSAAAELLGWVRSAIELMTRHADRCVVVVLPGRLPWLADQEDLAGWVAWYAAVGLVRGAAATRAMYDVRVNGVVLEPGHDRLSGDVVRYLLSPGSSWLNGYVLTVDDSGVGVLSDESPRWQTYATGNDFTLPAALGRELGAEPPDQLPW